MSQNYQVQSLDKLYRWLHPAQFKWDEKRPTSAAFKDPYMSVDIACLTTLEESYSRAEKIQKNAVASIAAQQAFDKNQQVYSCPKQVCQSTDEAVCVTDNNCAAYQQDGLSRTLVCVNPAHGCVVGKKTESIAKFFAKHCEVEIYPPQSTAD
jgi:hypothetical protein